MKRKRLKSVIKTVFTFCAVFFYINLYSQNIISRDPLDYPDGEVPGICATDPTDAGCEIILTPALPDEDYSFQIPLVNESDRSNLTFICINACGCSSGEINFSGDGTIIMSGASICESGCFNPYLEISVDVINNTNGSNDQQKYILPVYRNPIKVVLVLDISSSMELTVPDGADTRWNVLKKSINVFTKEFEKYYQEGDSISVIYFSEDTVLPDSPIDSNFIAITPEDFTPTNLKSSEIINADMLNRTLQDSAAMGNALLLAKAKLQNTDATKIAILFTDGHQSKDPLIHEYLGNKLYNGEFLNNGPCSAIDSIRYYTVGMGSSSYVPTVLKSISLASAAENLNTTTGEATDPVLHDFFQNQFNDLLNGNRPAIETRIIDLSPFDDSLNVSVVSDLKIYFNESVTANSGFITIMRSSDDSEFESIPATSGLVTGSGTSVITINPDSNLESNTEYYILTDGAAFKNSNNVTVTGISAKTYWNFITEDILAPDVVISTLENNPTNSSPFEITIEFSEEINGFDVSEIMVTNGSADNLATADSINFTANITPTADEQITIIITSNNAADNAGNLNTLSNTIEINFDSTSPSIIISTSENNPTNSSSFELTIEFSEEINGFDVSEINVTIGSADNLVTTDSIVFTANISPSEDGLITVSVNADVVTDNAGNLNTVSNSLEINFDSERPSVILTADNDTINTADFDVFVNFSEKIRGFSDSKITVTNGNINSLSTSDSIDFIASITEIYQGETDINVIENQVTDSAGNMNTSADELTITYYIPTNIEILKKEGILIYSNDGFVIVEFINPNSLNFKSGDIEIYSLNGSLIMKEKVESNSLFKTFLNNQRGIYLVKLTLDKNIYYAKIQNYI
ncbi:MAG: Ig-like domain-containing protein [Bacteroidales bacterium]|nr:Ig-like domain-containing protein [Bacteroidales bacterium]